MLLVTVLGEYTALVAAGALHLKKVYMLFENEESLWKKQYQLVKEQWLQY